MEAEIHRVSARSKDSFVTHNLYRNLHMSPSAGTLHYCISVLCYSTRRWFIKFQWLCLEKSGLKMSVVMKMTKLGWNYQNLRLVCKSSARIFSRRTTKEVLESHAWEWEKGLPSSITCYRMIEGFVWLLVMDERKEKVYRQPGVK